MKVLQLTVHYKPNIGGVETHLSDLVNALVEKKWKVLVLAYSPLTIKARWKIYEKDNGVSVIRIPWVPNLFYKLVSLPALEFLYLTPGLFFITPFVLLLFNPDVIHAHGLIAGFVGIFWGKVFKKRVIISTHSIYHFPKRGFYKSLAIWIFKNSNFCLTLSKQSVREIVSLGIDQSKVNNFTYWIDLNKFKKVDQAKSKLGLSNSFTVSFVGRLVEEKGLKILLDAAKIWDKDIKLMIAGSGPLEEDVRNACRRVNNIHFMGPLTQEQLPLFYSASDILVVPSTSEEGFGRIILEALACSTVIIGSKKGAIPEAMDETVGRLIDISANNIKEVVEYFYKHTQELKRLSNNCRKFAERRYSEKNVSAIINEYTTKA